MALENSDEILATSLHDNDVVGKLEFFCGTGASYTAGADEQNPDSEDEEKQEEEVDQIDTKYSDCAHFCLIHKRRHPYPVYAPSLHRHWLLKRK